MGFRAVLKTERGEELQSLPQYHGQLIAWSERNTFPMLGHIDPYGNTIFNRLQMESLSSELQLKLEAGPDSEEQRTLIEGLIELCAQGIRRPHRYLWLVGD